MVSGWWQINLLSTLNKTGSNFFVTACFIFGQIVSFNDRELNPSTPLSLWEQS